MKKILIVFIMASLLFSLSACAVSTETATTTGSALSLEGQLLVGTLKLETTDLAVSSDQASQLLPLWQTLQSLSSSGTAAPAETEAVIDQIKSTMTSQQVSSITAMNLTNQDLLTAMADAGASTASSAPSITSTTDLPAMSSAGGPAAPAGGNMAGGNPPPDIGSGPMDASTTGGSTGSSQAASTKAAGSQGSNASKQISPALIQALVDFLQKKLG